MERQQGFLWVHPSHVDTVIDHEGNIVAYRVTLDDPAPEPAPEDLSWLQFERVGWNWFKRKKK